MADKSRAMGAKEAEVNLTTDEHRLTRMKGRSFDANYTNFRE